METRIGAAADPAVLAQAAALLRAGQLVAFPTETVYGLGGDATNPAAVAAIFAAKGRPANNPLIVHVTGLAQAEEFSGPFPEVLRALAREFWPGPLTLLAPRGSRLCPAVTAGLPTVALRAPAHPAALELLAIAGVPVAAPSANASGHTSPTTAGHVFEELQGKIPLIVDGGACAVGIESTVLLVQAGTARILRPGAVTREMLAPLLARFGVELVAAGVAPAQPGEPLPSPGLLPRHYAPRAKTFYLTSTQWPQAEAWLQRQRPLSAVLLSHNPQIQLPPPHRTITLPATATAYAHALYGAMRQADAQRPGVILLLTPDATADIWHAIGERIRRAGEPLPM